MIARFWNWYQGIGLTKGLSMREARYVRALNGIVLIVTLLLWSQLPFIIHLLPATQFILIGFLLCPLIWQIVPLLNHFGHHTAARIFFNLSALLFVAFNAVQLGPATENHLFMISVFVGAFVIYPPRQFSYILFVAALAGLSMLALEIYYSTYGSQIAFPDEFIAMSRWSSLSTLFMMVLFIFIYHYRVLTDAENRLEQEHKISEGLLLNILPEPIAARLKLQQGRIADRMEHASILFADIMDFTVLANRLPHERVVEILDTLFSEFDRISQRYGLEKIKTIGDAYMVAGGVPTPVEGHAEAIADCALEMLTYIKSDPIPELPGLRLRIGIHSGPVVAGVICERKFAYDLWGDTVNTASRMESHGLPNQIQVSPRFYEETRNHYHYEARGPVAIKGKGSIETYLLEGRREAVVGSKGGSC